MTETCPKCGWSKIRRSQRNGIMDRVLRVFGVVPMRCRSCLKRFYTIRAKAEAAAVQTRHSSN